VLSTREVLIEDEIYFLLSLSKLEGYFYTQLNKIIENQRTEESSRFQDKLTNEAQGLKTTLEKIKSIVVGNDEKSPSAVYQNSNKQSVLFATCQLIGNQIGFDLEEPKYIESYQNSTNNQLYAIAKSSKIRIRKVILRGTWWKEENGHLLAFTKKTKRQ